MILEGAACDPGRGGGSLKKRWLYKFFANLVGLGMGFIIQSIVPRGLGPDGYGNFSFLTSFFTQVANFFDMGTSSCFYAKLSQRPRERELVTFYIYFAAFLVIGIVAFVASAALTGAYTRLWPGQEIFYIYLAAGFGILSWIIQTLASMSDAYGVTIMAEKAKMLQKVLTVAVVVLLYVFNQMTLANFFYLQYAASFLLIFAFIYIMRREGHLAGQRLFAAFSGVRKYLKEFYDYSHPLFFCSLVGMFANILDRWLLQAFGGSAQQGFFGFSFQLSALCFLFAGALTPLLIREFSISHARRDSKEIGRVFERYIPVLLFITAFFTCFIAAQSGTVTRIMGGEKYRDSAWPLFIMAFYPVYQVFGQACGSAFLAMGRTKVYSDISIFFMLIGIPVTYLFIAPKAFYGLNGGATGLALKMILVQSLGVNALLYDTAKTLKLSFRKHLFNQGAIIAALLIFAFTSSSAAARLLAFYGNSFLNFIAAGLAYTAMVAAAVYFFPAVFALRRSDIDNAVKAVTGNFKSMPMGGFR